MQVGPETVLQSAGPAIKMRARQSQRRSLKSTCVPDCPETILQRPRARQSQRSTGHSSGLILVAKDLETHEALAKMFRRREVRKQYTALVLGSPRSSKGEIDAPIGRHPTDRKRMSVRARSGRSAVTNWHVIE